MTSSMKGSCWLPCTIVSLELAKVPGMSEVVNKYWLDEKMNKSC